MALQSKKQVFVFTPTIALMHDQAKQLQLRGISAVVLGDAGMSIDDLCCYPSQSLIVYLTPEYIFGPSSAQRLVVLKELEKIERLALLQLMKPTSCLNGTTSGTNAISLSLSYYYNNIMLAMLLYHDLRTKLQESSVYRHRSA